MMTAVVLFAHGSPVEAANQGISELAGEVARRLGAGLVLPAFLDCTEPSLATAVEQAVGRGAGRIVVMPYFLTMGLHLRRDLPQLVAEQRDRFPAVEILVSEPLEGHAGMVDVVAARVRDALRSSKTIL